jgi:hypothetical protein
MPDDGTFKMYVHVIDVNLFLHKHSYLLRQRDGFESSHPSKVTNGRHNPFKDPHFK